MSTSKNKGFSSLGRFGRIAVTAALTAVGALAMPVGAMATNEGTRTPIEEAVFECFGEEFSNLNGTRHEVLQRNTQSGLMQTQISYQASAMKDGVTYQYSERLVYRFVGDEVLGKNIQGYWFWDISMKGPGFNKSYRTQWITSFPYHPDFEYEVIERRWFTNFDFEAPCGFGA
jgi:hypothetical protein